VLASRRLYYIARVRLLCTCVLVRACGYQLEERSGVAERSEIVFGRSLRHAAHGARSSLQAQLEHGAAVDPRVVVRLAVACHRRDHHLRRSKMLGGASQTVSKIRVKCNGI